MIFRVNNVPINVQIVSATDKEIAVQFRFNHLLKEEIKGLDGSKWDPDTKCWKFKHPKISSRNAFVLGYLTEGQLGLDPNGPLGFHSFHLPYSVLQSLNKELWPHQADLVSHFVAKRRSIWAAEMGTGKTRSFIEAYRIINPEGETWVVAPKAPLKAWEYEIEKWGIPYSAFRFISGSHTALRKAMDAATCPPQMICFDECSIFKTHTSQRTQFAFELSRLTTEHWWENSYIVAMSGTPSPKDPTDWWALIELILPGFLREKNPMQLRKRLAETQQEVNPYGGVYTKLVSWKQEELSAFHKRIRPIVKVVFKKDCLNLPEKMYYVIRCDVSESTLSAARIIIESTQRAVTALTKLRQLSDGFQYGEEETTTFCGSPKIDHLADLLSTRIANNQNRIIVYAGFTASIDICVETARRLGWAVIRVDQGKWQSYPAEGSDWTPRTDQRQFQDDDLERPVAFIANADSGGMGLTLNASDTIIYYSNSFNGQSRTQSEDRIHRGDIKGANIIDLIHLPTDEKVLKNLKMKRSIELMTLGEMLDDYRKVTL